MNTCKPNIKNNSSCNPLVAGSTHPNLNSVVLSYLEYCQPRLEAQLRTFADEATLTTAIVRAALAQTRDGKRYSHQRRIMLQVLQAVRLRLLVLDLGKLCSFDELIIAIDRAIAPIRGVGELLVYDTSLRIGAKLRLMPDRVYLHSGTRHGARVLGLPWRGRSISLDELPVAFRVLKPHEIEDCLCIFKDQLSTLTP